MNIITNYLKITKDEICKNYKIKNVKNKTFNNVLLLFKKEKLNLGGFKYIINYKIYNKYPFIIITDYINKLYYYYDTNYKTLVYTHWPINPLIYTKEPLVLNTKEFIQWPAGQTKIYQRQKRILSYLYENYTFYCYYKSYNTKNMRFYIYSTQCVNYRILSKNKKIINYVSYYINKKDYIIYTYHTKYILSNKNKIYYKKIITLHPFYICDKQTNQEFIHFNSFIIYNLI